MSGYDRTKWDYFLNMQWSEFQDYYIIHNERHKDIRDSLDSEKYLEGKTYKALLHLIK